MPKENVATIKIQNGSTHEVNVLCEFTEQVDKQKYSFIIPEQERGK